MVEIISLKDKEKWNEIVSSMSIFDCYHLNEYHRLDSSGEPFLFYYKDDDSSIAFPLLLRRISGTDYCDISSVYGYPGPISNSTDLPAKSIRNFQKELLLFFDSCRVVSAFSRLHPLFSQKTLLVGLNKIEDTSFTIGVDLSLPESVQRADYSHSLTYDIKKTIKYGVTLKKAESEADVRSFASIYRETMRRVHAKPYYFFADEYFLQFVRTINSTILLAVYQGNVIAGTLYTECNGILQIHLSATKDDFLNWSPTKYIWDQIRFDGTRRGCHFLHLGGAVCNREDGVSNFKNLFSKKKIEFKTWKYIHDQKIYQALSQRKSKKSSSNSDFFPSYRE
jgi:FemAB family.